MHWKWCHHTPSGALEGDWEVIDHIEIWSLRPNKPGFLPSYGWVNTVEWMHHMDANEMNGEKARGGLPKNATCCLEQTLEAALHKTVAVQPLTCHLTNHPSETNNPCKVLLKQRRIYKRSSPMDFHQWAHQQSLTYICSERILDVDWRTCQERWMKRERERERERVRELLAISATWWSSWWIIYTRLVG